MTIVKRYRVNKNEKTRKVSGNSGKKICLALGERLNMIFPFIHKSIFSLLTVKIIQFSAIFSSEHWIVVMPYLL